MTKLTLPAIAILSLCLAVACGDKKKEGDKKKAGAKKEIKLIKKANAKMGLEVLIPEGAKTLQEGKIVSTYSLPLEDGMHEVNVHLSAVAHKNMAGLVRMATMIGGKQLAEKKKVDGGFLVVKKPRGSLTDVWLARTRGDKGATVKVSVPNKMKDLALKIAMSLKLTP